MQNQHVCGGDAVWTGKIFTQVNTPPLMRSSWEIFIFFFFFLLYKTYLFTSNFFPTAKDWHSNLTRKNSLFPPHFPRPVVGLTGGVSFTLLQHPLLQGPARSASIPFSRTTSALLAFLSENWLHLSCPVHFKAVTPGAGSWVSPAPRLLSGCHPTYPTVAGVLRWPFLPAPQGFCLSPLCRYQISTCSHGYSRL